MGSFDNYDKPALASFSVYEVEQLRRLHSLLDAKDNEIATALVRFLGRSLTQATEEAKQIIDQYEALAADETTEEWAAREKRITESEIGRLLQQRHEIREQILDLRDANLLRLTEAISVAVQTLRG
jgi:DNA-binding transcriptional regulator YbjK